MTIRAISSILIRSNVCRSRSIFVKAKRNCLGTVVTSKRNVFQYHIVKGLTFMSNNKLILQPRAGKAPIVQFKQNRPLVVLLTWLLAKPKLVKKYANLYLQNGFDVLAVSTTPWQLLMPRKDARVTAAKAIDFLNENKSFYPVLVHCFSIGGFVWVELLIKMKSDMNKYKPTMDRIKGQIFESLPGPPPLLERGFAQAFFQNNAFMRTIIEKSLSFYLNIFYLTLTKPALKVSEAYYRPPMKIPTLLLLSKADSVSPFDYHIKAYESWMSQGITAHLKCWENAPHVGILWTNPEEYIEQIKKFMSSIDLINIKEKT